MIKRAFKVTWYEVNYDQSQNPPKREMGDRMKVIVVAEKASEALHRAESEYGDSIAGAYSSVDVDLFSEPVILEDK